MIGLSRFPLQLYDGGERWARDLCDSGDLRNGDG